MLPDKTINYLIEFLLGFKPDSALVGYCYDSKDWDKYKVAIVASSFFDDGIYGTIKSEPCTISQEIDGIPILFGAPRKEKHNGTIVVWADIIAASYYLISRYEEMLYPNEKRDIHGRYIGQKSTLANLGWLNQPLVDKYGELLRKWLTENGIKVAQPKESLSNIYLTHDIDTLEYYRHIRGFLGGIKRLLTGKKEDALKSIFMSMINFEKDPANTFDFIYQNDSAINDANKIYFIKAGKGKGFDYPQYSLNSNDFKKFITRTRKETNTELGLHISYEAGEKTSLIKEEKTRLENAINQTITKSRHHYLRSLHPEDFEEMIKCGIEEDYTMGYADVAGFRLGTSRAVKWINPKTKEVTPLILHHLTIMDCSLSEKKYMAMKYTDAIKYSIELINNAKKYGGEISLLWHNTTFSEKNSIIGFDHKNAYQELITYLQNEF